MIPAGLLHLLDQIKADPTIRLPLINLYGEPASGKSTVWNEMVAYIHPLPVIVDRWYSSAITWNYYLEGMVLIHTELKAIPVQFNDMYVTINEQMREPRVVRNVSHWITEYNQRIEGALNYEIKRS